MDIYFWINCFFTFSLLGYILECLVLTFENRQIVYNRGFGHGPFCIIYGFGAVGAALLLGPFADNMVKLYFGSLLMATTMELVTARIMIWIFGTFWWDYSHKKYNYKGIICLESSLGWGVLGIVFFRILNVRVQGMVSHIPSNMEKYVALSLIIFYAVDFLYSFRTEFKVRDQEKEVPVIGRMKINR
ncbi:MAG: putative ABC transporter permease [Clostridium sp.]